MKKLLLLTILLVSCQKDYYLADLNEAEALIQSLQSDKNTLNNRINDLNITITSLNQDNSNLLNDLNNITEDYDNAIISLEEAEELITELEGKLDKLVNGIRDGWYQAKHEYTDTDEGRVFNTNTHFIQGLGGHFFFEIINKEIVNVQYGSDINHYWDHPNTQEMGLTGNLRYDAYVINWKNNLTELEYTGIEKINMIFGKSVYSAVVTDINSFRNIYTDESLRTYSYAFKDPFYINIDYTDPKDMLRAFVEDAARHDIDISHALNNEFRINLTKNVGAFAASTGGSCNDDLISIRYQEENFDYWEPTDKDISRLKVFYHEFGHDILNLAHTCDQNNIMAGSNNDEYIARVGEHNRCRGEWVGARTLHWREWDLWTEKLFLGIDQEYFDCDLRNSSKIINIIE